MIYVRTVLVSIASAVVLFILTKLMGNKQISQINMFDYVTGITIGSIAAEMAVTDEDIAVPLIAMAVYALLAVFISTATRLSVKCRKILSGRPLVLFDRGVVYKDNRKKARLDMSDFLTMCRVAGYHDLTEIETAVLEYTGALSVLPKSQVRPATPADLQVPVQEVRYAASVVMDGRILERNLTDAGYSRPWLMSELDKAGYQDIKKVMLATVDDTGRLNVYRSSMDKKEEDIFE